MTQQEYQQYQQLARLVYFLQLEVWPLENPDKPTALAEVIKIAQVLGINIDYTDPKFLPTIAEKIATILAQPTEQPAPNIELSRLKEWERQLEIASQEQKTKTTKILFPTIDEQIQNAIKIHQQNIKKILLSSEPKLNQQAAEEISWKVTLENYIPVSRPEAFLQEEYQKIVQEKIIPTINQELTLWGVETTQIENKKATVIKELATQTYESAKALAATPHLTNLPIKTTTIPKEISPLPPEIIQKLNQATQIEGYSPAYTLLHPKAIRTLIQRTFYTIPAKIVQATAPEASVEFQKMALGLFPEDFRGTASRLRSWGLDEKHPIFQYLKNQADRFDELQKTIPIKNRRGDIIGYGKSRDITTLERYFNYVKHTGKWQGSIDYGGQKINLLSSVRRLWDEGGYGLSLKQSIGRFRFTSKIYQKVFRFISRGKYDSLGVWTQKFVYGKVLKPILIKLGKTVAGQVVKAGVKKAAGWLATKAGIKLGIWAAGAATAAPSAGVSLLIAAAIEIGTRILGKIKNFLIGIFRDPEKAFMAIGAGILALVFIPMPFALIAILPLTIGGLGLITFIAAPATLGAIGGGISGFFTALAAPIVLPIAAFIIILFSVLAGLTLLIVMVVSGAFILPSKVAEVTPTTISPYESDFFTLTKTAPVTHLENNQLPSKVTYTITLSPRGNYILIHPQISEEITVFKESNNPSIAPCNFEGENDLGILTTSKTLTCEKTFDNRFNDSEVINTIKISTGVEGQIGLQQGIAIATITIGNPPMDCPSGWPTTGRIAQGPEGTTSHGPHNEEAIDIGNNQGMPVYATHRGTAKTNKYITSGAGFYIEITGTCNGQSFRSEYYHLLPYDRASGPVNRGQLIGYMDSSGGPYASHLHYEFRSTSRFLRMEPPYIPVSLPLRSCDSSAQCHTIATGP